MDNFEQMPFIDKYPVFRMLAEIGDLRKLTPEEHELYDEDIKNMRDLYAAHTFEMRKRREARENALIEGERKQSLKIAKNMLLSGMPDSQISKLTGLTQEQINEIKGKCSGNHSL